MICALVGLLLLVVTVCKQYEVVFVSGEVIRCIESEREALLAFKRGLIDEYDDLSSWGSEDEKKECCNWHGVRCSNTTGSVIHLHLTDGFRGEIISPVLLKLHHLNHLDLTANDFGGKRLPEFIGSMKALKYLHLSSCNISGIVPHQIGNLTNLVSLDLSWNSLRSENLNWLSHLSSLSNLDFSGNNISDTNWPHHLLMLHSLTDLRWVYCQLGDGTPSQNLLLNSSSTSLSSVHLSHNYVTSATLDWLFNIKSLVHVGISNNQLDGLIPDSIKNLTFLEDLDLFHNKLKGGIPKSFSNLNHLNTLYLNDNDLRGSLGESIKNLSCSRLEYLFLSNNQFGGSVPDLSSCVTLIELDLQSNKLEYLPTRFGHLMKLEYLDVSHNSLKGSVSKGTFINVHNLKFLNLSSNPSLHVSPYWNPPFQLSTLYLGFVKLGPQFPTWIQILRNLSTLDISDTGISDDAPHWLWNFSTSLYSLKVSNNKIRGTIPHFNFEYLSRSRGVRKAFSSRLPLLYTNIQVLQLSHDEFYGSIIFVCNMPNIVLLDISYNHFSGELPNCWKDVSRLTDLNLGSNSFSGKIPSSLGSLQMLFSLQLNDNYLSGELPSTFKNCQYLSVLDVGGNKLTGNIPKWIGSYYVETKCLILSRDRFFGNIPEQICNVTQIQVLDLSRNNLSGKIPRCFNKFSSLKRTTEVGYYLSLPISYSVINPSQNSSALYSEDAAISVQWKSKETKYQEILGILKLIDLSSNKLNGNIPPELFELKGLASLNLSRNSLDGLIPPNIDDMKMLESLDLSANQLSGAIPDSLGQLHYLQVLDLSHNILSGKIPPGTQLQSFNESSYAKNAQLCGRPLDLCPGNDAMLPPYNPKENGGEGNWFMYLSLTQDLCISMAFGFIFGFWGLIGLLVLKRSWRITYFAFFDGIGDWVTVKTATLLVKFRPR